MSIRARLRIRTRIADLGHRVGWHVVPTSRYDIARRDFYSPLPDLGSVPAEVWEAISAMRGITFDVSAQFTWAEHHLTDHIRDFQPPARGDLALPRFFLFNWSYQAGDAEILYALIRSSKPKRIIELGSGFSTLLMAEAVLANRAEGYTTQLDAYDPYPPPSVAGHSIDGLHNHHVTPAQDIPLSTFESLTAGDILFVDTTHTVKIGSEVNRLILDILPALAPGVLVHFHDILLPYEYPRWLVERMGAWNEQYLLQAFLINNLHCEVLLGLHAMARADPQRLTSLAPHYSPEAHFPTAFWLRTG